MFKGMIIYDEMVKDIQDDIWYDFLRHEEIWWYMRRYDKIW